eukprot:c9693_g1_i1.p1 GENE.c9693_g1_i1~~c9693_g1_i1.p1  ORF type:complete len:486 (-),score=125.91 c9693_g1_i1:119-1504(-)
MAHLNSIVSFVAANILLLAQLANAGDLYQDLQSIVDQRAKSYNCSYSVAIQLVNGTTIPIVSGSVDGEPVTKSNQVTPDDLFVWGSVTKVWTGAAVMRLADQGLISLDEPAFTYVDPMLKQSMGANMADLFGSQVNAVTIRQLLAMQSGIPDFDTAKPYPTPPTDAFRKTVYENPDHDFIPSDLLSEPWVKTGKLLFPPGSKTSYSSTNFVLLGMLLANLDHSQSWDLFDQFKFIPSSLAPLYHDVEFVRHGSPSTVSRIQGLDRTNYNNRSTPMNVFDVHGVFSGWTASNFVGSPLDAARFIFDVYGPEHKIISEAATNEMIPTTPFYGLATFNLSYVTGDSGIYGTAYGHLGATYGYDSIVAFFPGLNFSIAVGTNIETDAQAQPADAMCGVYNRIKNALLGEPVQTCAFVSKSYYGASCNCTITPIPTPTSTPIPSFEPIPMQENIRLRSSLQALQPN